jgi:hypothetical protein
MRGYPVGDLRHGELRGELDRLQAIARLDAATAQVRSAWFQLAAVIAMFLTVIATVAAPSLAHFFRLTIKSPYAVPGGWPLAARNRGCPARLIRPIVGR